MGVAHVLPTSLSEACGAGHPLELWVLDGGRVIKCRGLFMGTDERGRPRASVTLPEGFIGILRGGCAVRAFFADTRGAIQTFVSSLREWRPYRDRPISAATTLEAPAVVSDCQRRQQPRVDAGDLPVTLSVVIRGQRESVEGRLVDTSANGVAVRLVRSTRNWFGRATRLRAEFSPPDEEAHLAIDVTVTRVTVESLSYLYGFRVEPTSPDHERYTRFVRRVEGSPAPPAPPTRASA